MNEGAQPPKVFHFGPFWVDTGRMILMRGDLEVDLRPKALKVLLVLLHHAGRVVPKDQLVEAVWPDVVVNDDALAQCVRDLRKALEDVDQAYIRTLSRRGYVFVHPISVAASSAPPKFRSVAVLPFEADHAEDRYIADGLAASMINALSQLRALRVVPRASVERYRGSAAEPTVIGEGLDVEALVMGRLSRSEVGCMVQLDLIDVAYASQVWGEVHEGETNGIIPLQKRMQRALAHALGFQLSEQERKRLTRPITDDPTAYQAYLRARYGWDQRSEQGLRSGLEQLQLAVSADPEFAHAHSGLAHSYVSMGQASYLAPSQAYPAGKRHATRALELDPSLVEARVSLGRAHLYHDWDWSSAKKQLLLALDLDPRDANSLEWYSVYLFVTGEHEESFRALEAARRIEPLGLSLISSVGVQHYYAEQFQEAIKELTFVLEVNESYIPAHLWLARCYLETGRYDEALYQFRWVTDHSPGWCVPIAERGGAEGSIGRRHEAFETLAELQRLSTTKYVPAYGFARVHAGLGDFDTALDWLTKAFEERSNWLIWLRYDPRWKALRGDPRFTALVSRLCLP